MTDVDHQDAPSAGRRAAAALALLALVAVLVITAGAFLRDPVRLGVALVLVVLAVMAGWTALVHRGTWRVVASGVAVVALAAVIVLVAAGSLLRTAVLVGLALLSVAMARVALGHDLAEAPADLRPVGPARRGVLLINPRSGGGKAERFQLEAEARRRGVTPVVLHPGDDLRALAEQAADDGADVLGMAGGDGSQALVADVARAHDVPLVVVPAGTRNHFALDWPRPRRRGRRAGRLRRGPGTPDRHRPARGSGVRQQRLPRGVRDRRAVRGVSRRKAGHGRAAGPGAARSRGTSGRPALLRGGRYVIGSGGRRARVERRLPPGRPQRRRDAVPARRGSARCGDRDRRPGPRRARTDGRAGHRSPARLPGYREWTTPEFLVDSDQPLVEVGVDGEALRLVPPLRFRVVAGGLRVRVPVDAPGAAPAAMAPAGPGAAVAGVLRVLGGRPARASTRPVVPAP